MRKPSGCGLAPVLLLSGLIALAGLQGGAGRTVAQATAEPSLAHAAGQYTPVVASVFSTPRWFTGSDGRTHLVYELSLLNAFPIDVTISSLTVLDGGSLEPIATYSGDDLAAITTLMSLPAVPTRNLAASATGMVWLDIPFAQSSDLPSTVLHRLTVSVPPGLPVPTSITTDTTPAAVDLRAPIVLAAPLAGSQWAAVGSCCDGPHRRSVQPVNGSLYLAQRFAIDFNQLDDDNRFSRRDPARNESYPTYGQPVFAVADATVVAAVDRYQDQVPGQTVGITLENADGNYIVLDLGDENYAFYAHLKPGSVQVQEGDIVDRGQLLGEAGNTGSSDGPHLHFHVMNGPAVLASDGLPYVFAAFDVIGRMPPLNEAAQFYAAQEAVPVDTAAAGQRTDALPLGGDIVEFPGPATSEDEGRD